MDKQLLKALDNLSEALEMIAEALSQKKEEGQSSTSTALQSGDFVKTLEEINEGVKSIKVDTQEILKNQKTIMALQKQKEGDKKTGIVEEAGGSKEQENKLKTGIGIILLIAIGVLAIGMAFKLVGSIDVLSVIALSLAILLIANAFAKLAELKFELEQAKLVSATLVILSIGITLSSWIMSLIIPITLGKLVTAILIAGTFAVLSTQIHKMIKVLKDLEWGQIIKAAVGLVFVMPAIALGIALASFALQLVQPISFTVFVSSILIAAIFAVVSFGIRKMLKAFDGIDPKSLLMSVLFLPLVLPAIALGIALASYALKLVQPVGFMQFISSVMVGLVFVVLAFGIKKMISAFKEVTGDEAIAAAFLIPVIYIGVTFAMMASSYFLSQIQTITFMQFLTALGISILFVVISFAVATILKITNELNFGDVIKLPILFTLMSLAIAVSAYILNGAKEYLDGISFMMMIKILFFSVTLSISIIAIAVAMKALELLKVDVKTALKGSLAIVIIAVVVMITSHILSLGNYEKYPPLEWALGVGAAIVVFGVAAFQLGSIPPVVTLLGSLMVLVVSAIIMISSRILSLGKYDKFPPLLWTLGVVAVMVPFALVAVALGAIALTGIGLVAFAVGLPMVLTVAKTIVEVASILSKGKYDNPGMLSWAVSTTLLYAAFTPILLILGAVGLASAVASFFGPNPWELAREMMVQIAETIVDVAGVFAKGKFTGGPKKEWAESVGIAIGAFSPVYAMLMKNKAMSIFGGGGGVGPADFAQAIKTVSQGIVDAAKFFADAENAGVWGAHPTKEWAEGVGTAIGAFAPVFEVLTNQSWLGKSVSVEDMKRAIMTISEGIVDAAKFFARPEISALFNTEGNYPSESWGRGVGGALNAFAPVFESLSGKKWYQSGDDIIKSMSKGIIAISGSIVVAAYTLSGAKPEMWESYPSESWGIGIKSSITNFMDLFDNMEERGYSIESFKKKSILLSWIVYSMANIAKIIQQSQEYFGYEIPKSWTDGLSTNVLGFANLAVQIESLLTVEKEVTKTDYGFFGNKTVEKTMVKERKDLSLVKDVVNQMATVAGILFAAKEAFDYKIDPNYMKGVSQNVLDFSDLVKKLAESESTGGGLFSRITDAAEGLLGTDPISQIAHRMVTLAKGYDAMANALMKLSAAMRMLKVDSMAKLGGLTRSMLDKKDDDKDNSEVSGSMSKFTEVGRKKTESPSVSSVAAVFKNKKLDKDSIFFVSERLEELIKIMSNIERQTSTVDEYIETKAKIKPPPEKSDFG